MTLGEVGVVLAISSLLVHGSLEACTCNGKSVPCREDCLLICSPDGVSAEICGQDAGEFLTQKGKEEIFRQKLREAANLLLVDQKHSEVYLRDDSDGKILGVPGHLIRPFSGINLEIREAAAVDVVSTLATVAGIKLDLAGQLDGAISMGVHDGALEDIMDNFCQIKRCIWTLRYSADGWTLQVAGEAGKAKD
jgi:hypothetical protein